MLNRWPVLSMHPITQASARLWEVMLDIASHF